MNDLSFESSAAENLCNVFATLHLNASDHFSDKRSAVTKVLTPADNQLINAFD